MRVTTAHQSAQRDAAAIASGTEGFALMLQAGTQAAAVIMRVAGAQVALGVDIFAGSGNNGGDGYIVAAQLLRLGVKVRVVEVAPPATPDAKRAAAMAHARVADIVPFDALSQNHTLNSHDSRAPLGHGVIVDALLGTGARGELRDHMRSAAQHIRAAQERGSLVVALDMPTGVDATTGELTDGHLTADATIMFGTMRIGALSARDVCGDIWVVDIGLGVHAEQPDDAGQLATVESLTDVVPMIGWNAHKGVRGRTLIVGGSVGMAGAVQLASSGALASGAGLVRASVAQQSVAAMQACSVAVVCSAWPALDAAQNTAGDLSFDDDLDEPLRGVADNSLHATRSLTDHEHIGAPGSLQHDIRDWAHVVAVGPGLGRDAHSATLLRHVLECTERSTAALVLDADALTVLVRFGMLTSLRRCAGVRPVVITPHLGEFGTLSRALDIAPHDGSAVQRLSATRAMANALQCTVLSKGTPSICASAAGDAWFVPRGSNALATGGTGDVLTGVIAALLATACATRKHPDAHRTAALAALGAWVHGVAGEGLTARGSTVADVARALPSAWAAFSSRAPIPPGVLTELPWRHEHVSR